MNEVHQSVSTIHRKNIGCDNCIDVGKDGYTIHVDSCAPPRTCKWIVETDDTTRIQLIQAEDYSGSFTNIGEIKVYNLNYCVPFQCIYIYSSDL